MMAIPGLQRIMINYIDDLFAFIMDGKERRLTFDLLVNYKDFRSAYKEVDLNSLSNQLRSCSSQIIPDLDIL